MTSSAEVLLYDDIVKPLNKRSRGRPPLGPEYRERLIQSAIRLVDAHGEAGLQARLIATDAGISVGSLYKLIGDMDDVILEVSDQTQKEIALFVKKELEQSDNLTPREKIIVCAKAYWSFVRANQNRWGMVLNNIRKRSAWPNDWRAESKTPGISIMLGVLNEISDEITDEQAVRFAYTIYASVHGIVMSTPEQFNGLFDVESMIELAVGGIMDTLEKQV